MTDKIVLAQAGAQCSSSDHGGGNTVTAGTLMIRDGREGHCMCVDCAFGVTSGGLTGLVETLVAARQAANEDTGGIGDNDDGIDWTDLPTFGGTEPRDTSGIWSWDETHLLVGDCLDELEIEDRA